ncbi:MAG: hypothetical protein EXR08_04585 [Alphaproteobacteria bacterium]|nr:hypothetical protein [Alphaproteobacteria bacterium]
MVWFPGYSRKILTVCSAMFLAAGMWRQAPAQELTVAGVQLAPVVVPDMTAAVVEKQVPLGRDMPEATYVVVQFAGVPALMRDRQGVFQPWDIDAAHLADNGFAPSGGQLNFKIFSQDLSDKNFPMTVTMYYRARGELKFGYFDIMRAN